MFRQLAVAIDGSESARCALDWGITLAGKLAVALEVVSVAASPPPYVSKRAEVAEEQSAADRYFGSLHAEAALEAAQRGVSSTTRILSGHVVPTLLDYVRDRAVDLLIVGASGHSGVWDIFIGSTADKLVAHVPSSILVVHAGAGGHALKELVVGYDGSPLGDRALVVALELGRQFGGPVRVLSVAERTPTAESGSGESWRAYLDTIQGKARDAAEAAGVRAELAIRQGHAAETLARYATEVDADALVVGATGLERPSSPTAGGTARRVANEARCAVLIVRPGPGGSSISMESSSE